MSDKTSHDALFPIKKTHCTIYTWDFENISQYEDKKCVVSKSYVLRKKPDVKWRLILFPKGRSSPDHVALYIQHAEGSLEDVLVECRFIILNVSQRKLTQRTDWLMLNSYLEPSRAIGDDFIVTRSRLFERVAEPTGNNDHQMRIMCVLKLTDDRITRGSSNCRILWSPRQIQKAVVDKNGASTPVIDHNNNEEEEEDGDESSTYDELPMGEHLQQGRTIKLLVDGQKIEANVASLEARSDYFRDMFKLPRANGINVRRVKINDVGYYTMRRVVEYLHKGKLDDVHVNTMLLLEAADKYVIGGLKRDCEDVLAGRLNKDNAAEIFLMAHMYRADRLKDKATRFIVANSRLVIDTPGYEKLKVYRPELVDEIVETAVI